MTLNNCTICNGTGVVPVLHREVEHAIPVTDEATCTCCSDEEVPF